MEQNQLQADSLKPRITLRKATPSDAGLIAEVVMSGMGFNVDSQEVLRGKSPLGDVRKVLDALAAVAAMDDTLYSYRNTYVAVYEGKSAGCLVSYNGGEYKEKSRYTFALISGILGVGEFHPGQETCAGEYYLDSLAVLPEFRGHSISRILIGNALEVAQGLGFTLATLIVDKEKPWLHRLYSSLGFRPDREVEFCGEPYIRMVQDI